MADDIFDIEEALSEETASEIEEIVKTDEEIEIWKPGKTSPITLLHCNTCYLKAKCPMRDDEADYCPIKKNSPDYNMATPEGLTQFIQSLLEIQQDRIYRLAAFEQIEGGIPDPNVSQEIKNFIDMLEKLKKILTDKEDFLVIKARGKNTTGIIEKLFGDL